LQLTEIPNQDNASLPQLANDSFAAAISGTRMSQSGRLLPVVA